MGPDRWKLPQRNRPAGILRMKNNLGGKLALLVISIAGMTGCTPRQPISDVCHRGYNMAVAGSFQEAIPVLSLCLESRDASPALRRQAYTARAWANKRLDKPTLAVADQEAAFQIDPAKSYHEFINYAFYLRAAGRASDSLAPLKSAEAMDKAKGWTSMMTQYHLGWTFQELKKHEEAVAAFSRGIPSQPEFAYAYYRRGLSQEALGRKDRARADFEKVNKLIKRSDRGNTSENELPELRKKLNEYGIR